MWISGICELKSLKHTRQLCPTSCEKNECGKWESRMRDVCIPGTLYQLAPLVMPSSKYSSGYRSSQGCPLCMRGFSCTHKNTHKWEVNNVDRCTQVFKPCLPTDFTKIPWFPTALNSTVCFQWPSGATGSFQSPGWNRSHSVQLPVSTLWTPAERSCRQVMGCTESSVLCHHHRGSLPPRNLHSTTRR